MNNEHYKMNHIYVGVDLHKEKHVAIIVNCWHKRLSDAIEMERKPSAYEEFIKKVNSYLKKGQTPIFGLEDTRGYGRSLAVFLAEKGYKVKEVNPAMSSSERRNNAMVKKNDAWDAECIARVLNNRLEELEDANPLDIYWTFSQLTNRRNGLVKTQTMNKNQLHDKLSHNYPSYKKFFSEVDGKTALEFWEEYPSPSTLKGISLEELTIFLREHSNNVCSTKKAEQILNIIKSDGDTTREYQEYRDYLIQSIVGEIKYKKQEIKKINKKLSLLLKELDFKLTTMVGVDVVTASNLVAQIGDINRFKNPDKLAKYAGIAPVKFSSAGKGTEKKSKQGDRQLNGIFYMLALQQIQVSKGSRMPRNPAMYEYYQRKIQEGKSSTQALVCIMRRLVYIIYKMMKNKTEYKLPTLSNNMAS